MLLFIWEPFNWVWDCLAVASVYDIRCLPAGGPAVGAQCPPGLENLGLQRHMRVQRVLLLRG